jgi:hypothetical protein
MPYVNIKITREGATASQKAELSSPRRSWPGLRRRRERGLRDRRRGF